MFVVSLIHKRFKSAIAVKKCLYFEQQIYNITHVIKSLATNKNGQITIWMTNTFSIIVTYSHFAILTTSG